ncbi:MAG TPA: hypothetical protein VF723_11245 [Pyrinomonadaceae bacterium]|jgi:hypothetical protein
MAAEKSNNVDLQEGIRAFLSHYERMPEEIERTHSPFWNARYELAKNVISLASASLVLTVTFSTSLTGPGKVGNWKYLLICSWIAFLLSLISATSSLWVSINLKTVAARFLNQSVKVMQVLDNLDLSSPNPTQELQGVINEILVPLKPIEVWQGRFLNISLIMFMIALTLLGAFGWKQFAV